MSNNQSLTESYKIYSISYVKNIYGDYTFYILTQSLYVSYINHKFHIKKIILFKLHCNYYYCLILLFNVYNVYLKNSY